MFRDFFFDSNSGKLSPKVIAFSFTMAIFVEKFVIRN